MRIRSRVFCVLLALGWTTTDAAAQDCDAVLRLTGRDEYKSVDRVDQEAWYYRNACSSASTSLGVDYFEQAQRVLGFTYANKQEYCDSQAQRFQAYRYAYKESSEVLESSTKAWLRCVELKNKGLFITPTTSNRVVTFSIRRGAQTEGKLRGVEHSTNVLCKATVQNAKGQITEINLDGTIGKDFAVPNVGAMTVYCTRSTSTATDKQEYYPAADITLVTSEGPITIELPASILSKETWASEVQARVAAQQAELSTLAAELRKKIADVYDHIPNSITFYSETALKADKSSAYDKASAECPDGWVAVGVYHTAESYGVGPECHQARLVKRTNEGWWDKRTKPR